MPLKLSPTSLILVCALLGPLFSASATAQHEMAGERGWLGVQLQDLSERSVRALIVKQPLAILVERPIDRGPVARAGLRPADVILALDGASVTTAQAFTAAIQRLAPGKEVRLGLWRRGRRLTLPVTLGSLAEAQRVMSDPGYEGARVDKDIYANRVILQVFPRERFPEVWSRARSNLGDAYAYRTHGDRADNMEKAIAEYKVALAARPREADPIAWAGLQTKLARAYASRVRGNQADNLDKSIASAEAALTVLIRQGSPVMRAAIQTDLADLYTRRPSGARPDNLEKAVALLEAALTVFTREDLPEVWASAQHSLAVAYVHRVHGDLADNLEKAIAAHEAALTVYTREAAPLQWAMTQGDLAIPYTKRIRGDRADNLEKAIAANEAALTVFTREKRPTDWAAVHNNLGNAYEERIRGDRADNLEKAISAFNAALTVSTRDASPVAWADAQNNLGNAYVSRVRGDRAENLEKSIAALEAALTVRSREDMPIEWAQTQNNVGNAFADRIGGDRAGNLEKAIAAYEAALTVQTREAMPDDWAATQQNLANAYLQRVKGNRADNLEKAIAASEAALTVRSREAMPLAWATTQNNLGLAYESRIRGNRADNLEKAIAAYEAALNVRTRETLPLDWAQTQNNLGLAYEKRVGGNRADNLEKAIAAYEAALTVTSRETVPAEWAANQNNLGIAYSERVRGDRADNLEKAIAAFEAALTVRTREASPVEWAQAESNVAIAYTKRIRGSRAENLEKAIAAFGAALTVHTQEGLPREHLDSSRRLGQALLAKGDWVRTLAALLDGRATFRLLFGQGLDEAEAAGLVAHAGPLFSDAAFAAIQTGNAALALSLLSQGRAQLMAVALRQQGLKLSSTQRTRHEALKVEIRQLSRTVEATSGSERFAALTRLAALRSELDALVKAGLGEEVPGSASAQLGSVLPVGGALAAPIVTDVGGKLLIVAAPQGKPAFAAIDLPRLTTARVQELMRGSSERSGGWLGAFAIQNLADDAERDRRYAEWLAAIENVGSELWEAIGGPLHKALAEQGIKPGAQVLWMPPGALGLLPIGLAMDRPDGVPLSGLYEMSNVPSLEALIQAKRQVAAPSRKSLMVAVNPTNDLPFTEIEGTLVSRYFAASAQVRLDKSAATPEAVLQALRGRNYWHFSSHGTFCWSDARKSGLIMAGTKIVETCGFYVHGAPLTVGHLLEREGALGRPRLVVLSACETGIYDIDRNPDEFVGLPATFMQLGAAGVLGTLWQVDDLATALLVAKFYDLHLKQGERPAAALKQAQTWLRSAAKTELIAFAQRAAGRGQAALAGLARLEDALSTGARSGNARFARAWELLQQKDAGGPKATSGGPQAHPFAHPYYWGGFVYTGL